MHPLLQLSCLGCAICEYFDIDLQSLFNWNTKQLFVYLEAEYSNVQGVSRSPFFFFRTIVVFDHPCAG